MTPPLYELTNEYRALQSLAAEEDPGAFETALQQLGGELSDKAIAVAKVIRSLEAEAAMFKGEADRLRGHSGTRASAAARLKDYLQGCMEQAEVEHIKGDVVDLRLQAGPKTVEIEGDLNSRWQRSTLVMPLALVPGDLMEYVQSMVPDKKAIMEWITEGNEPPKGVTIVQRKHLRIR